MSDRAQVSPPQQPGETHVVDRLYDGRTSGSRLEIAVQEDLVTLSSPDFSVHLGLKLAPM